METNNTANNVLIARFMNYEEVTKEDIWFDNKITTRFRIDMPLHNIDWKYDWCLQFHESWDWLMPVVEKIEDLGSSGSWICIQMNQSLNVFTSSIIITGEKGKKIKDITLVNQRDKHTKIETIYNVVVEFIKWYNGNSKSDKED